MKNSQPSLKEKEKNEDSLLRQGLSKATLLATLLAASTQLTKHWWPAQAFIYGTRIDYLAPSLSLFDIAVLVYLTVAQKWDNLIKLTPILLLLAATLLTTSNQLATLVYATRLILYLVFVVSLDIQKNKTTILLALAAGILGQTALAIAQVIKGASVGGAAYLLGERMITTGTPNVAKAQVFGKTILRAYGTFSHPNTLAGWLIGSLYTINILADKRKRSLLRAVLVVPTILLTQSRAALAVVIGILVPTTLTSTKQRNSYARMLIVFAALIVFAVQPGAQRNKETIQDRLKLQKISYAITQKNPLFGAGLNSSLERYQEVDPHNRLLQPDHNSVMLLVSQLGLMGLATLALFWKQLPKPSPRTAWIFAPLLLIDHYFITSPQALFMLLLAWKIDAKAGRG